MGTRLQALTARLPSSRRSRRGGLLVLAGMAMAGAAVLVQRQARQAEIAHPARGRFVTAGGVRLHYVEQRQRAGPSCFCMATGRWSRTC